MLWFAANYSIAAGLEYTTVGSSTILMSTSSIWTFLFGVIIKVEDFSIKKLLGVLASLIGIVLISTVDLSGGSDKNRGCAFLKYLDLDRVLIYCRSFPHKSPVDIALGDLLSLVVRTFLIQSFIPRFFARNKIKMKPNVHHAERRTLWTIHNFYEETNR